MGYFSLRYQRRSLCRAHLNAIARTDWLKCKHKWKYTYSSLDMVEDTQVNVGGVSVGSVTFVRLRIPIRNRLRCTVCSDTFLSEAALTFSAICATVAVLLHRTTRASVSSPRASISLGRP